MKEVAMKDEEKFALWIAEVTLRSSGREVDAITVDDLAKEVEQTGNLESKLEEMHHFEKRGGDFGAEIVAAMIIPILIEAGKQLWAAYLKKLADKAGGTLADVTVDEVKTFFRNQWGNSANDSRADYEAILRSEAGKQGLSETQTSALVEAIRQQSMARAITAA